MFNKIALLVILAFEFSAHAGYHQEFKLKSGRVIQIEEVESAEGSHLKVTDSSSDARIMLNSTSFLEGEHRPLNVSGDTVTFSGNTKEGWDSIKYLHEDALALAFPFLQAFVQKHKNKIQADQRKYPSVNEMGHLHSLGLLQDPADAIYPFMELMVKDRRKSLSELRQKALSQDYDDPEVKLRPLVGHEATVESPLIVTHAGWYGECVTKPAIDELVETFKTLNRPVVYLLGGSVSLDPKVVDGWNTKDRSPTLALHSNGGEHCLIVPSEDVVMVGDNWGQCQQRSIVQAVERHFKINSKVFKVFLPAEAITGHEIVVYATENLGERLRKIGPEKFYEEFVVGTLFHDGQFIGKNENRGAYPGLSLDQYKFKVFINDQEFPSIGNGSRQVELHIGNMDKFRLGGGHPSVSPVK
jgi:hypothetical protein